MNNREKLSGGASLALALAFGLGGQSALAQPAAPAAPAPVEADAPAEEVVEITGSFIRGTPEDAAIPVHATTLKELQNLGSPSNMDLVKSMTDSGAARGEGDRRGAGSSIGVQTINLRQLGSNRTLVLLNGHRLQDQSSVGVRFSNIAVIPNAAVGRVETLQDGGAVTYGSDAVGGVVNFITRHDFNGLQTRANFRAIDASDGDYDLDALWGTASDNGNIMVSSQFTHRSTLFAYERDFAVKDYLQNNATLAWSSNGSPGSMILNTTRNPTTGVLGGAITPVGAGNTLYSAGVGDYARQMGTNGQLRDPGCSTALDAFPGWSAIASGTSVPICYYHLGRSDKLVEESDTYQGYGEVNYNLTDSLKYHGEVLYYLLQAPNVVNTPSESTASFPTRNIVCTAAGAAGGAAQCVAAGDIVAINTAGYTVAGANPAVADILNRLTTANGNQSLTPAQKTAITTAGGVSLTGWRPFGAGGNPLTGGNEIQRNRLDQFRTTQELTGDLPKFFGTNLNWKADVTGIHTVFTVEGRDMLVDRLQAALNGFGGPNCTGTVAGANGCEWFNPFSTAVQKNAFTGVANPLYQPTLANSYALVNWLQVPIRYERDYTSIEGNFNVNGEVPVELPGGKIAIAAGGQYRYQKELFTLDDLSNRKINPCPTVGTTNCTTQTGPLVGNRASGIFGATLESKRQYPAYAAFGEIQLPIFDNLTADLAMRYEKFISDTGSINNSVVAPQGSIKWQVTDSFALRGVAGSTFANVTPPENNPVNVVPTNTVVGFGVGASPSQFNQLNTPNFAVSPETGFNYNIGAIFNHGPVELKLSYYNIKLDNLARSITVLNVLNGIALQNTGGTQPAASSANLVNCSSPLITQSQLSLNGNSFVTIAGPGGNAACVQGSYNPNGTINTAGTTFAQAFASSATNPASVRYHGLNRNINGGDFQTDGIDASAQVSFNDVLGGNLQVNLDTTKVLSWDMGEFRFGGALISAAYNGVGYTNTAASKADGQNVFEYKSNLGVNYTHGRHNFNWRTTFFSGLTEDNTAFFALSQANNANVPNSATAGVVDAGVAGCTTTSTGFTTNQNSVIPGSGTGAFGSLNTATNTYGLCLSQQTLLDGGHSLPNSWNSDFTYRLSLPADTVVTATVQNVFDRDPSFTRQTDSYNSFLESPLGRTVRIGLQKKF